MSSLLGLLLGVPVLGARRVPVVLRVPLGLVGLPGPRVPLESRGRVVSRARRVRMGLLDVRENLGLLDPVARRGLLGRSRTRRSS